MADWRDARASERSERATRSETHATRGSGHSSRARPFALARIARLNKVARILDIGGAREIPFTRVSAQVRLQTLLAREHPVAVGALDATRRRTALLHEIRQCVGARPAAPVALGTVAGDRSAARATAARVQASDVPLPILRRGARAART